MTTIEPTAWAVYGRKTGSLRYIVADDETARDLAEYYDVVPLYPAATPPADDVREALIAQLRRPVWDAPGYATEAQAPMVADAVLAAFEVRPRGTVTDAGSES